MNNLQTQTTQNTTDINNLTTQTTQNTTDIATNTTNITNLTTTVNNLSLNDLTDCTISNTIPGDILTYDSLTSTFQNKPKPTYTLTSLTDVNIVNPANESVVLYDQNTDKFISQALTIETQNYFSSYTNTALVTFTNISGFIPLFSSIPNYITQLYGDAFTIIDSTQLQINRAGTYEVSISFQPSTNQTNIRMYVDNVITVVSGSA